MSHAETNDYQPAETDQQAFQPDPQFAMAAQADEITKLRNEVSAAQDRIVYLSACLRQMQAEANAEISHLKAETERLRAQLATTAADVTVAQAAAENCGA